ncbi:hypothetical protein ACFV2N_24625 [Streptomyces sp. NPDC059680]|uniref:hypothetical protein n=1 Tax=Streptomyces TaxID=1883 RepID=UPI00355842ED
MRATDMSAIATDDTGDPPLRPLPDRAAALLAAVDAPPRLVAHLRAVHEVAADLVTWLQQHCPRPAFDADAVLPGSAWRICW